MIGDLETNHIKATAQNILNIMEAHAKVVNITTGADAMSAGGGYAAPIPAPFQPPVHPQTYAAADMSAVGGAPRSRSRSSSSSTGSSSSAGSSRRKSRSKNKNKSKTPESTTDEDEESYENSYNEDSDENVEEDDDDKISMTSTEILQNDPLFFVLSRIFVTHDKKKNIADLLQELIELLRNKYK